jgi:hypothetical protein
MDLRFAGIILTLLLSSFGNAQIKIENPNHLDLPEQQVQMLHNIICRVVAEEFRIRGDTLGGPVTLVVGNGKTHGLADEVNGEFTIYLDHWDEPVFAMADMRLAVQRTLTPDRWNRMAREIIHRMNEISPITADKLRTKPGTGNFSSLIPR